jgi:hypothetical protein
VTSAAGPPSELKRSRLRQLAERFGLGADSGVAGNKSKAGRAKERPPPPL